MRGDVRPDSTMDLARSVGVTLLLAVRSGPDRMPRTRLETGNVSARAWLVVAALLLASAVIDGAVALAHLAGLAHWQPWLISFGAACVQLVSCVLVVSYGVTKDSRGGAADHVEKTPVRDVDPNADAEIMARLDALFANRKLYLDPDLTLGRMSRRLGAPVKNSSSVPRDGLGSTASRGWVSGGGDRRRW